MAGKDIPWHTNEDPPPDNTSENISENIPLQTIQTNQLDSQYQLIPHTVETELSAADQDTLKKEVDSFYKYQRELNYPEPPGGRRYQNFTLDKNGVLRLKNFPNADITYGTTGKPYSISSIKEGAAVRNALGYIGTVQKLTPKAEAEAREVLHTAQDAEAAADADLPQAGSNLSVHIRQLIAGEAYADGYSRALGYTNLRDLTAGAKFLETARGNLVATQGKLRQLDTLIEHRREKIQQAQNLSPEVREFQERELESLRNERAAQYKISVELSEGMRNQIGRIRETIYKMLNYDTSLRERIRTLFREQGITIASILTAFGMCISTIVLAIRGMFSGAGASGPSPPPPPPPPGPGLKEWMKRRMLDLGQLLLKLGEKAAAAIPGIIGSIVSWLLGTLGKAAVWAAGHLWVLLVALGGLILAAMQAWLTKKP